jgi:D-arabinan endo alpha-(1,5)-arabinofuranosidase
MPRLKNVTGVGVTTKVAMESADLGILRWDAQRGAIAAMFGDNFEFWRMGGEWQSPSIVMYDVDGNVLGIPTVNGIVSEGRRRQLWDYPHNNEEFSTILPCDFINVNHMWYVAAMVTAGLGHEKRTIFWQSKNLIDWEKTSDPYVSLIHLDKDFKPVGHPGNVMLTFDRIKDWVYIFGTGGLARDKPIWLWRNKASEFPQGYWEPWGRASNGEWAWGNPNEDTPILNGRYGELCFRYIQGNCVLSFFDVNEYKQTALTTVNPTDDWTEANQVDYAWGQDFPQLYGGYIVPGSKLNEPNGMLFWVSQWNTSNNDPYWVVVFADTLQAKGPLLLPEPEPLPEPIEPEPIPEEPEVTSPQDMYDLLLKELAASGSTVITDKNGKKLTLREAVAGIYLNECSINDLKNFPVDPRLKVNQLDHVRSARSEGLFTQSMVLAIADKLGIDSANLYYQVRESIG